ncbi:MAG: hypothetical protein ACOX1P_23195 [Thermoguttaceae bacterium]|jgi:hypothetical protein
MPAIDDRFRPAHVPCQPPRSDLARIILSVALAAGTLAGATSRLPADATASPETNLPAEIIFAVRQPGAGGHWYENFGYYAFDPGEKVYGSQGRLCRLDLASGRLAVLLEDEAGAVRDPQVHYDGRKILFSYRRGGSDHFHLYEIGIDGGGLTQLTSGPYDDFEPTYLPDGRIIFISSRCNRWVNCWYTPVATLHCCDKGGRNIRPISANIEHDNTPWPMLDGRVIYQRWEYVDRSRVKFHHLWTANPDGTGQMVYFGNMHPGTAMLDENGNSVKRMHSFLTVMPGETTGCSGCHENRTQTTINARTRLNQAVRRPPSPIEPVAGIPEVFDFPRDIQPILDAHCTRCHNQRRRDGRIVLSGDNGPIYSHAYYTLTALSYVSDGRDRVETNLPPRSVGTSASPLMKTLDGSHYQARLSPREQDMIRYWIESAAPYPGTYAALGTGMVGGYPKSKLDTSDRLWPSSIAAAEAIERRCSGCHDKTIPLPKYLSDDLGLVLSNPDFSDVRVRFSRHLMFNLSHPAESLILLAPLAAKAGGLQLCRQRPPGDRSEQPAAVFRGTSDPDYEKILAMCRAGSEYLDRIKRFNMPGFRPSEFYVREMKRFGILPPDADPAAIDVYQTDQAYWASHWWRPEFASAR